MHKFLRHAGFFLTLIARSMAQHILDSGRIKVLFFNGLFIYVTAVR